MAGFTRVLILGVAGALLFSGVLLLFMPPGERGGVPAGTPLPEIQAAGWVNGSPPDLQGQVVVVYAWATWCLPCYREAPELLQTYRKFRDAGDEVVFIGLTAESPPMRPRIEEYVAELGIEWPVGYGADQSLLDLQAEYLPSVWVADRRGEIIWNYDSPGTLESAIRRALRR